MIFINKGTTMCKYSALLVLLQFLLAFPLLTNGWVSENRRIEQEVLRNYDRRHRPVKSESTIVKVQLFLTINHVEKVDELEGTMLLHGILWASWNDENLRWSPAEHNNTQVISMETWKIWQPTFALYNSARSNNWFIYLNGVPATVSSEGRVFAAGTFTFQVTCQFDFSDYPYDVQECPIVLADWMFDLSKVNLSEAVSNRPGAPNNLAKPALRLSFDPLSENTKRHVAGWEVLDTWQRLCYWGPNGYCIDKNPIGPLDNYWSLIEFGVRIKRHAPYYGLTLVLPIFITIFLTLLVFWVDNLPLAIFLCVFNLLLESYSGLGLTQQLPPGDGVLPTIGVIHLWNVSLTLLALVVHSLFNFLLQVLPPDTKFLPEQLTNFTALLRQFKFFRTRGLSLSFDPQTMIGFESPLGNHIGYSGLEEEDLSLTDQPSPDSMIIEMDTVAAGTAVESTPAASNSQFQAIQLGTEGQSSSQTSDESLPSKKSLFGNMFSQRKQKPKKISSPFSSLFGSQNLVVKKSETNSTTEMNTDEAQLLVHVGPAEEEKAEDDERSQPRIKEAKGENEEEEEADSRRRQAGTGGAKNGGGGGENGNGNGHGPKEVEQSPLEQELQALRRILFGFVLLASAILILMLIF